MKNTIKKACESIGVSLTEAQLGQFESYYRLLIEWNEKINLTRITEPDEVAYRRRHGSGLPWYTAQNRETRHKANASRQP